MKKLFSLLLLLCVSVISYAQIIDAVHWRFSVKDISDSEKELVFTANMDDGWHLYGMNIPDGGPAATTFSFDETRSRRNGADGAMEPSCCAGRCAPPGRGRFVLKRRRAMPRWRRCCAGAGFAHRSRHCPPQGKSPPARGKPALLPAL